MPRKPAADGISFSFKYWCENSSKFTPSNGGRRYCHVFLQRLKAIERMTMAEFLSNRSPALKAHVIDFNETTEAGFPELPDDVKGHPYQFSISGNKYGRVHGVIVGSCFLIIWCDPTHLLYDSRQR